MRRKRFHLAPAPYAGPERAAIYARVSTANQKPRRDEDDKLSLEDQEIGCRQLCQSKGYVINEAYVVREVSSGDHVHRPLLEEIYAAAKRGEVDVLVMYKVNRFARNDDKAAYLYGRALYEHQMRIEFVEAPPNEKIERFHMKFKSIFAEEYRDEVMRLTLEKKRERVTKRGLLLPGAWPLFGYKWDNDARKGRYLIDEEAAAIVRRIFALAAAGDTLLTITRLFNAEHVPTPSVYQSAKGQYPASRPVSPIWRRSNINRLLHTPAYWGEHAAYRYAHSTVIEQDPATGKYETFHEVRLRKPGDEELIPLPPEVCPPLVEKWQAQAVHQRLQANKREASKKGHSTTTALLRGGYVECGYCGRPMYCVLIGTGTIPRYRCRSVNEHREGFGTACAGQGFTVHHHKLDQAVWQDIVNYFSDPDWLEHIVAHERQRQEQQAAGKQQRLKELEEALATKEADADHLVALTAGITTAHMRQKLQQRMNEVGAEIEVLEHERAALLTPPHTEELLRAQQEAFHRWAEDARVGLEEELTIEEKRRVLYWLGVQVRVFRSPETTNYELTLTWRGLNAGRPLLLHSVDSSSSMTEDEYL